MNVIQLDNLPFCAGCSHELIFRGLDEALAKLNVGVGETVVVSDIGCQGIADQTIDLSTFHGLHGRSITYASGMKLARPDLRVIVLTGDGGCGIGGAHLINAARRNIGICVLVFNNFNFGMTGGQHSVTTPLGGKTTTTPAGTIERPFDISRLVEAAGAGFVARMTANDPDLPATIERAIAHDGFALMDIWGVCTAHYMKRNELKLGHLSELAHATPGYGVRIGDAVPEYAAELRRGREKTPEGGRGEPLRLEDWGVEVKYRSPLDHRLGVVLAGSAGMRVGTAATILARAAILSGLYATQKSVIPVTVMKGFSLAELILSPEPIEDLQVSEPDWLVISSEDGFNKSRALQGVARRVLVEPSLAPRLERAEPLHLEGVRKNDLTFGMAVAALADVIRREALAEVIESWARPDSRARLLATVERALAAGVH